MFKKVAFTLAEVLIVLGIIGVIAQMTIPTLYNNVQKQVTVVKLQKFYATFTQAIELSEIDNGSASTWDYVNNNDGTYMLNWYNTYLAPYIKTSQIVTGSNYIKIYLADGTIVYLYNFSNVDIWVWFNESKAKWAHSVFCYRFRAKTTNPFQPIGYDEAGTGREKWTTGTYACNTTAGQKKFCAGLIMYDGWRIADDYPW